jgi:hypothetical protein
LIKARFSKVRPPLDRALVARYHLLAAPQLVKGKTTIEVLNGVAGLKRDGALVARHRLLKPPQRVKDHAAVGIGPGKVRPQLNRAVEARQRLLMPNQHMKSISAIAMAYGKAGLECEGAVEIDQRRPVVSLPPLNDSEKKNCIEVIRFGRDDLFALLLGPNEFARLVVGNGAVERLRESDCGLVHT